MFRDIFRKEILDHITSMKFVVTFAVVMVLVISGLMIGTRDFLEKQNEIANQTQRNQGMMEAQSNWLTAGYIGVFHSKEPYVLSIIDHGIDNSLGRQSQVSMGFDASFDQSRNLMAPILAVFGDVDLSFVVKIILSLFVILLTFDTISGEKERGTLKLTLSNNISRSTLILGKMLGGFTILMVAFLLPVIMGLMVMMIFYPQVFALFTMDVWVRFLLIILSYMFYLGVFFALGMFVSAMSQKSSTAFIVLLMIWVIFVAIIPRLSLTVAERLQPYESYATLQTKAIKEVSSNRQERLKEYNREALIQSFQEGVINDYLADMFSEMTELQQEVMGAHDDQFNRQQASQIQLAESISRVLSPASALSFASQNLSGTGYDRQKEYVKQLREFQKEFRANIMAKLREPELKTQEDIAAFFSQESLDVSQQMVKFNFTEETVGTVLSRAMFDIALLAVLAMIFFASSYFVFIRYDVR